MQASSKWPFRGPSDLKLGYQKVTLKNQVVWFLQGPLKRCFGMSCAPIGLHNEQGGLSAHMDHPNIYLDLPRIWMTRQHFCKIGSSYSHHSPFQPLDFQLLLPSPDGTDSLSRTGLASRGEALVWGQTWPSQEVHGMLGV